MKQSFEILSSKIIESSILEPLTLNRGDKIMVRNHDDETWIHAYFDRFDPKGNLYVIDNGRSPWTTINSSNQFTHELTQQDIEWGCDDFPSTCYAQFEIPEPCPAPLLIESHQAYIDYLNKASAQSLIVPQQTIEQIHALKRGDRIQVRYNENDKWINCYFDRFWTDGRVQAIPNGKSPWTETNGDNQQRHMITNDNHDQWSGNYPHFTSNFYRIPEEITNSGDLRKQELYIKHWN